MFKRKVKTLTKLVHSGNASTEINKCHQYSRHQSAQLTVIYGVIYIECAICELFSTGNVVSNRHEEQGVDVFLFFIEQ